MFVFEEWIPGPYGDNTGVDGCKILYKMLNISYEIHD